MKQIELKQSLTQEWRSWIWILFHRLKFPNQSPRIQWDSAVPWHYQGHQSVCSQPESQPAGQPASLSSLITLPFSHSHLIKYNYLYSQSLLHTAFLFYHYNLLSHVDWSGGIYVIYQPANRQPNMVYFPISLQAHDLRLCYPAPLDRTTDSVGRALRLCHSINISWVPF